MEQEPSIISDVTSEVTTPLYIEPPISPIKFEIRQNNEANKQTEKRTLFLGGLKPHITKENISQYFETWGAVTHVRMKLKSKTRCNKGFAFVNFEDSSVIDKIILEPHFIDGRKVECKLSLGHEYNRREQEAG
jgi:RNA recognition motif-containing protein